MTQALPIRFQEHLQVITNKKNESSSSILLNHIERVRKKLTPLLIVNHGHKWWNFYCFQASKWAKFHVLMKQMEILCISMNLTKFLQNFSIFFKLLFVCVNVLLCLTCTCSSFLCPFWNETSRSSQSLGKSHTVVLTLAICYRSLAGDNESFDDLRELRHLRITQQFGLLPLSI